MPEKKTVEKARKNLRRGKSPSTAAGEFVREEIHHVRRGKHGARSTEQAIAIGLSKARRAGVPLPPPSAERSSPRTRRSAQRDQARGRKRARGAVSSRRRKAALGTLAREPRRSASKRALSKHAKRSARRKGGARRRSRAVANRRTSKRRSARAH